MSRMPSVGDVIDDVFRVEEELDHGNFGAVYKVADLLEKRTLALKVLKPGPHDEEELRQRFDREARLIYSLRHPHVLRVYYYGHTAADLPYMAMEYLKGTDLKALLRHHGALSEPLTRRIAIESLAALHCAHSMDIIHRDLKPANIYLVDDGDKGHVKVLDFGFAKALDSESRSDITNAGTLVGTPAYMSPELVHKRDVGPQADIYAMGLILAEMVSGTKVVQIESIYDTVIFQGSEKPIKLSREVRSSPFVDIIKKAISKDLGRRYDTALEMIDDLRRLDLPGVGSYTDDVPLATDPPEVGTADTEARTTPRSDGRPSLEEVERSLHGQSAHNPHFGAYDDDPTIEHRRSFESNPENFTAQAQPVATAEPSHRANSHHQSTSSTRRRPNRQLRQTANIGHMPAEAQNPHAAAGPAPQAEKSPSALRDVIVGIVVGAVILGIILLWMSMST